MDLQSEDHLKLLKNKIYKSFNNNSIKYLNSILNQTAKPNIETILSKIAYERYTIELILSKLFPTLNLDSNLDSFGRVRNKNLNNCGRMYNRSKVNKLLYSPFSYLINDTYEEVLYTPIKKTYGHYKDKVKNKCVKFKNKNEHFLNKDKNKYLSNIIKNEPAINILHKINPSGFTVIYKEIVLTTFYYELDCNLYSELDKIPIKDRYLLSDIHMYRSIYHGNTLYHEQVLVKINKMFTKIITNVNNKNYNTLNDESISLVDQNVRLIKKIFWFLSQSTLYERGSCAITEILCNSLLIYVMSNFIANIDYKIFFNKPNINQDIEAMLISNPNSFIEKFDEYINYKILDNIDDYYKISKLNIDNIEPLSNNIISNFNNFNIIEYLFQNNNSKKDNIRNNNIQLDDLMEEFYI